MLIAMQIRRRLLLRRLAGGSAVFWTLFGDLAHGSAIAGVARRPLPLVILDPGHGGRDRGATGVTGTLEKDVTLASALTLKASLEASGRYRVALTRGSDRFLRPESRVDMARDLGANLFLSLH